MKVVMVGPVYPYRGGISHHMTSLIQAFHRDHEVYVLSFDRQYPTILYPGQSDKDTSDQIFKINADFLLDPLDPRTWRKAKEFILHKDPDLVIFNWWVTIWSLAFKTIAKDSRRRGIMTAFIIHNLLPHERRFWDRFLAKHALQEGDFHILHSSSQASMLHSLLPGAHTVLSPHPIYNLIDVSLIPRGVAREQVSVPKDVALFLFFGIVRPYKGIEVLLKAIAILKRRDLQPHVMIAGEFWQDKNELLRLIDELGISPQIHIRDEYIPNEFVPIFFSAANAFVAPYTGGTQSGSLALALGFGLRAIATEHVAQGVERGRHSSLTTIPENDPLSLANQMEAFIRDPAFLHRQPIPERGDWGRLVRAITDTFKDLSHQ